MYCLVDIFSSGETLCDELQKIFYHCSVMYSATPLPTAFLDAREVPPPVTVKLSWKDSGMFKNPALLVKYTIIYHREGDSYNQVKIFAFM